MSSLVRESERAQKVIDGKQTNEKATSHEERGLTDGENPGNIFQYIFAGHKMTSNLLTDSILLLAAHRHGRNGSPRKLIISSKISNLRICGSTRCFQS